MLPTIPSGGGFWGSSQAIGFKNKDILFGSIVKSPDINKHFLTSKYFIIIALIKSHSLPERRQVLSLPVTNTEIEGETYGI
jgi:hypothetical protein